MMRMSPWPALHRPHGMHKPAFLCKPPDVAPAYQSQEDGDGVVGQHSAVPELLVLPQAALQGEEGCPVEALRGSWNLESMTPLHLPKSMPTLARAVAASFDLTQKITSETTRTMPRGCVSRACIGTGERGPE